MKILLLADEIWKELSEPSDLSVSAITFWLRINIGKLNNQIGLAYKVDPTNGEITPDMGIKEQAVFKALYMIYFYDKLIRASLGAASIETVLEVSSDGGTVRKLNKTTLAQTYIQMRKQAVEDLQTLTVNYKGSDHLPLSVTGDDYIGGRGNSYCNNDSGRDRYLY